MILLFILFSIYFIIQINCNYVNYTTSYFDKQRNHSVPVMIFFDSQFQTPKPLLIFTHGFTGFGGIYQYLAKAVVAKGIIFASLNDYNHLDITRPYNFGVDLAFLKQAIPDDPKMTAIVNISSIAGLLRKKKVI